MSTVPTLQSSCIAPDGTGKNLYLIGTSTAGKIDAYLIDLSDSSSTPPTAKHISSNTNAGWRATQGLLGCNVFLGDNSGNANNAPINVIQFGKPTVQAMFYPNGTWITPTSAPTTPRAPTTNITAPAPVPPPAPLPQIDYQSPQTYTLVAAISGNTAWFVGKTLGPTGSWRSIRKEWTNEAGQQISTLGTSDSLMTVGAMVQDPTRAQGYLYVFDQSGSSGTSYRVSGSRNVTINAQLPLMNLTNPSPIDMGGIQFTGSALPVPSVFSAYIIDKSATGTVDIFMLDVRTSSGASRLATLKPVNNKAPKFLTGLSVTALNSKLAVYGGQSASTGGPNNDVHIFDILSGQWQGPSLVDLAPPSNHGGDDGSVHDGGNGLNVAMIGGIVAGAAVFLLAFISFFVYRRRTRARRTRRGSEEDESKQQMLKMLMLENKSSNHVNIHPPSKSEIPPIPSPSSGNSSSTKAGGGTPPRPSRVSSSTTLRGHNAANFANNAGSYSPSIISLVPASPSVYGGTLPDEPAPPIPSKYITSRQDKYSQLQRQNTNPMAPIIPESYAEARSDAFAKPQRERRQRRSSRDQHYKSSSNGHDGIAHSGGQDNSSNSSSSGRRDKERSSSGKSSHHHSRHQRLDSGDYKVEYIESQPTTPAASTPNSPRSQLPKTIYSSGGGSGRSLPSTTTKVDVRTPSPSSFPLPPIAAAPMTNEGGNITVVSPLASPTYLPPPSHSPGSRTSSAEASRSPDRDNSNGNSDRSKKYHNSSVVPPSPKSPHLESLPRPLGRPAFNHSQIQQESAYFQQQDQPQQQQRDPQHQARLVTQKLQYSQGHPASPPLSPPAGGSMSVSSSRTSTMTSSSPPMSTRSRHRRNKSSASGASTPSSPSNLKTPTTIKPPPLPHLQTTTPSQKVINEYQPPPSPTRSEAEATMIQTAARTRIQYDTRS